MPDFTLLTLTSREITTRACRLDDAPTTSRLAFILPYTEPEHVRAFIRENAETIRTIQAGLNLGAHRDGTLRWAYDPRVEPEVEALRRAARAY